MPVAPQLRCAAQAALSCLPADASLPARWCAAGCAPRNETASKVEACQPLQWRLPATEEPLYSCHEYGLAFTHERPARNVSLQ
jgi:hypothetical protein